MKKIIALLAILMLLSLTACGKNDTSPKDSADTPNDTVLTEDESGKAEEEPIDVPKKEKPKEMSAEELETEIQKQPCFVTECEYYVQDDQYKALYPDLMMAQAYETSPAQQLKMRSWPLQLGMKIIYRFLLIRSAMVNMWYTAA